MSLPTVGSPTYSPISARDFRAVRTPKKGPSSAATTPGRELFIKREVIESVFRRYGWTNPKNGTWNKPPVSVDIPHGSLIPRAVAKELMGLARENGVKSTTPHQSPKHTPTRKPLRERNIFFSPAPKQPRSPEEI